MHSMKAKMKTAGLFSALALIATGCGLPRMRPASRAESTLRVFVDPDVTISEVADERGRAVLGPFHDALNTVFYEAGFKVVNAASEAHDLTVHVSIGKLGYTTGVPWGYLVALDLSDGNKVHAHASRDSINYVHLEGPDVTTRMTFAARRLVNVFTHDLLLEQYAVQHTAETPAAAPTMPTIPATAPISSASTAPAGAAAPATPADAPPPAGPNP
jgi:hypothetical protein